MTPPAFATAAASHVLSTGVLGMSRAPTCGTRAKLTRRDRMRRVARMAADPAESPDAKAPVDTEEPPAPPEPYPGFYRDMERAGMSQDQARAQAAKAASQANPELVKSSGKIGGKASLLGADGKPLAPWMNVDPNYKKEVIKKKGDARGRLAGDPQSQELSGQGLSWKMLGDELELRWGTGVEDQNQGFIVSRRKGKTEIWEKVADYNEFPADLQSKGPSGGAYSFIVQDPQPGSWVYRISDVDAKGNISDLSQTLVDIDSSEDSNTRLIALAGLLAVIFGFLAFSLLYDPLSGTS